MRRIRLTITLKKELVKKIDREIDGIHFHNRSNAIERMLEDKLHHQLFTKAVILGGEHEINFEGKPISPLLLPVRNTTLIEYNINALKNSGIKELIISAGKWENQVKNYLNQIDPGLIIHYHSGLNGTASVLREAKQELEETFLLINGAVFLENIDLEDIYHFHKEHKGLATLTINTTADATVLKSIIMQGARVINFKEKPSGKDSSSLMNAGLYLFEPKSIELIPKGKISLEDTFLPVLARRNKLFGYHLSEKLIRFHNEKYYRQFINKTS